MLSISDAEASLVEVQSSSGSRKLDIVRSISPVRRSFPEIAASMHPFGDYRASSIA